MNPTLSWLPNSSTQIIHNFPAHRHIFFIYQSARSTTHNLGLAIIPDILPFWVYQLSSINQLIKHWTRPVTILLEVGALADLSRSRPDLIVENALLRQQLIFLNRQIKHPKLTNSDRIRFVFLAKLTKNWHQALHIVQPDTLLRWHRDLFRLYWWQKSKPHDRKPRLTPAIIELIQQIARENRLWGAERIRGELLKLGIKVNKRTIQRYLPRKRKKSSQTWRMMQKPHPGRNREDIWWKIQKSVLTPLTESL